MIGLKDVSLFKRTFQYGIKLYNAWLLINNQSQLETNFIPFCIDEARQTIILNRKFMAKEVYIIYQNSGNNNSYREYENNSVYSKTCEMKQLHIKLK